MDCAQIIQSQDTIDLIVAKDEMDAPGLEPRCRQYIDERYSIWYYDHSLLPELSIENYSYSAIPKVFWLMDSSHLDVSGILSIQNQPTFALKGDGVLLGIVDTGIDYRNTLFRKEDGSTRIVSIWDQTEETTQPSERFLYGQIYEREQINAVLFDEEELERVPGVDENGHGTYLASVAAGGEAPANDFVGAAPNCELVIVKLKPAKQNIRKFFYLPEDEPLYQENDIMAGLSFLEYIAERERKPLVILLGLGSSQGSHIGTDPLSTYLDSIGMLRGRAIVVPTGNEASSQCHFYGQAVSSMEPAIAEVNVEASVEGFCMELWSYAPELVRVVVQSPTGQQSQGGFPISSGTQITNFVFENTQLELNYRIAGRRRGDLLVFFRFSRPTEGVWTIRVYPENGITGAFHMWLPIQKNVGPRVSFIRPNPDTTLTTPSSAEVPISVGGYDGLSGAIYVNSGRGFDALGRVKPDFCAPCVDVSGANLRSGYTTNTGTSIAAAITAGAAALCLEWGILRGNAIAMNSVEVKNLLIRGCQRAPNIIYPSNEWGYGKLEVYESFEVLRE